MNYGAYGGDHGASQFGGGGFMPSPAPGADNQYGGGGGQKGRNQQTSLRAFTIRHLLRETANVTGDDPFMADGHDVSTVTFVGKVTRYEEHATKATLLVNDGTGSIHVESWIDDVDAQPQKRIDWQVGRYVRVYGNLKTFDRRRSVTAFAVKPITDHNEVTYHFLQSIMQHLHLTKGAPPTGQPLAGGAGAGVAAGAKTPGGYGGAAGGYGAGMPPTGYGAAAAPPPAGPAGGDIHVDLKHVYNLPHAMAAPNGISVEQAATELRNMGRNYSMQQVLQACEYLAAEGVLYSTINDTTFKSTGS